MKALKSRTEELKAAFARGLEKDPSLADRVLAAKTYAETIRIVEAADPERKVTR